MKTILLSLVFLATVCTDYIHAQVKAPTDTEVRAMFCGASNNEAIRYTELANCTEVVTTDKEFIIKSFKFSYVVPSDISEKENVIYESKNSGSKLTDENLGVFKSFETKKVSKLYLEEIVATDRNGKNERKLNDVLLILK